MAIKYDVVVTTGTYQNKDGEKKFINKNVGAVIEAKHGLSLVMDATFNPAGCQITEDGKVWLKLFEPKDSRAEPASGNGSNSSSVKPSGGKGAGVPPPDMDGLDYIPF